MRRLVKAGQGPKRNSSRERSMEPAAKNAKGSVRSGFDFDTEEKPKPPKEPEMRMRVDPKQFCEAPHSRKHLPFFSQQASACSVCSIAVFLADALPMWKLSAVSLS